MNDGIGAIDLALWDLKAKINNEPLWKTLGGSKVIGPLLVGLGQAIEIAPLRSSTSDILNLASVAAYSAGVINYNKKN